MQKWYGQNYVGKKFYGPFDKTFENINPSTEESLGSFPLTSPSEVGEVILIARKSFKKWRKLSRLARAEYFYKISKIIEERRDELARVISLETGKNFNESIAEVNEALHMAQFAFGSGRTPVGEAVASEIADKDSYMLRKPKGVIAIVSPFNFPVAIGAFWCAAPALVEGNTVILKPSEDAPMSSQICAEIFHEAGIPEGVFNLIHGDGKTGDALVRGDVDHICFTGSAEVGQHIRKVAAESWHKTTSCEMGSKSAVIVFDDATMSLALDSCLASAFKLSGQRCVSASRLIIQREIVDEFAQRFVDKAKCIKSGNPFLDENTINEDMYYGPIINEQGLEKVVQNNNDVFNDSEAIPLLRGKRPEGKGFFISPTVYKTEWRDVSYLKNEVFGPHVAIIPFDTLEDAIRIYNDTDYGLAVGVLTNDFRKARIMRDECEAGMIYWNGGSIAAESHLAFGGVKKSGNGFPSAARTFRAVTHEVSWTVNHADDLSFPQGMK
jgi:aldehyde dehydrogenase (NAD+)